MTEHQDAVEIARKLTKAQRRVVCQLPEGKFVDAFRYCRQRRTRVLLTNRGVTEPFRHGPVIAWYNIRLTPLGLAVRAILTSQAGDA